jgi:hypothetical protein
VGISVGREMEFAGRLMAGCRHRRCRHVATWTCRHPPRRHGPHGLTPFDGGTSQVPCRRCQRQQALAGTGPGGTCHVSPGQGCRHRQVIFFVKLFQKWSFLTIHWRRWSDSSKILILPPFSFNQREKLRERGISMCCAHLLRRFNRNGESTYYAANNLCERIAIFNNFKMIFIINNINTLANSEIQFGSLVDTNP